MKNVVMASMLALFVAIPAMTAAQQASVDLNGVWGAAPLPPGSV